MPLGEKDKLIDLCKTHGVGTAGCRTAAHYRAALDAQAPQWQQPAAQQPAAQQPTLSVIERARARAASSGPAIVAARRSGVVLCLGCGLGPPHSCTCGRKDPRGHHGCFFENRMDDGDDTWFRLRRWEKKGDEVIEVADTVGSPGPKGWGIGIGLPLAKATYRSKAMALSRVPLWKEWVWNHLKAQQYVARALTLLGDKHEREDHGYNGFHGPGMRYEYRAGGGVVKLRYEQVDGARQIHVVSIRAGAIEGLLESEALGDAPQGVATYTSCLAADVLRAPETCLDLLVELDTERENAAYEEADVKCSTQKDMLRAKLKARIEFVQEQAKWPGRASMFDGENKLARHLINKACPRRRQVIETWVACQSNARQSKDATQTKIREALGPEGYREIIVASLPHLSNTRFRWQLDWLVKNAQIDHIFSGVIDHPANLYLDWSCPNGHFGNFRNCPGKAARYGAGVMAVAAEWVLAAVDAALGVVSHSVESA